MKCLWYSPNCTLHIKWVLWLTCLCSFISNLCTFTWRDRRVLPFIATFVSLLEGAPCEYCHAPCLWSWLCFRRIYIEYGNVYLGSCWIKYFYAIIADSWRGQSESPGTCVSAFFSFDSSSHAMSFVITQIIRISFDEIKTMVEWLKDVHYLRINLNRGLEHIMPPDSYAILYLQIES